MSIWLDKFGVIMIRRHYVGFDASIHPILQYEPGDVGYMADDFLYTGPCTFAGTLQQCQEWAEEKDWTVLETFAEPLDSHELWQSERRRYRRWIELAASTAKGLAKVIREHLDANATFRLTADGRLLPSSDEIMDATREMDKRVFKLLGSKSEIPRFLVLEGIDGSGTTTQLGLVAERLRARGHVVLETREPSRGPVGILARQMLAAGATPTVGHEALALLFAADRLEHLAREILPALARGEVVICDRYLVSSWVYQSINCDPDWIREINDRVPWPDLTFVLSLPAEVALERVAARRSHSGETIERFDEVETQKLLAHGYAAVLDSSNRRGLVSVDAELSIEQVTEVILSHCIRAGL